jgi:hypothetical protein
MPDKTYILRFKAPEPSTRAIVAATAGIPLPGRAVPARREPSRLRRSHAQRNSVSEGNSSDRVSSDEFHSCKRAHILVVHPQSPAQPVAPIPEPALLADVCHPLTPVHAQGPPPFLACLEAIAVAKASATGRFAGDLGCRPDGGDQALQVPIMTSHPRGKKKAPADTGVKAGAGVRDDVFYYLSSYRQNLEKL